MFRYFVVDDIVLYMRVFVYYYLYFYMRNAYYLVYGIANNT